MKFYFSVVSHQHHNVIFMLNTIRRLALHEKVTVICRDNKNNSQLEEYCRKHNVVYLSNDREFGFSTNNNRNFLHAIELGMQADDYFILLNPDVFIDEENLNKLIETLRQKQPKIAAPNLYLDHKLSLYDDNLRRYPTLINFVKNYLFNDRSTVIDKSAPEHIQGMFWASGAFIIVKAGTYLELQGFDESYYMYCEDVDFCRRANLKGEDISFFYHVTAVHFRHRCSHKFLSRAFFRHVNSVIKYNLALLNLHKSRSCLHSKQDKLFPKVKKSQ